MSDALLKVFVLEGSLALHCSRTRHLSCELG